MGNQASTTSPQTVEPVSTQGTATQDQHINTNSSNSRTPSQVNPGPKIEGLIDAYFARKEYTKKTGEVSGTLEYEIGSNGNKTSTDAEKEKIAKIILEKPKVKDISKKKEYTTIEAIKDKLTKGVYNKGEKITFQTFKLGEEFKRITNAPLEDKLYLVASSYLLEGKNAKIIIKEKDGLIKGSADAVLPALEITEAQMEQSEPLKENERTEKTEFSGTIKKVTTKNAKGEETQSEMLIIPIQLRPKSDDDLKIWKEKIAKGKKDGTHTYKANKPFTIGNEQEKNQIADTITSKSNKALGGTHQVFKEDVIKLLSADGKTVYNEVKDIPKYKKEPELLYLHVTAQGTKQHDQKFLKSDNYETFFKLARTKEIIFPFLVKPDNDILGIHKNYYWADKKGDHQATFNSNRKGGRKHAGRDLYSQPYTEVVSICDGIVLDVSTSFADGTGAVTVLHQTNDGRKFIVRYGEVENNTVLVSKNDIIKQKDVIGKTGWLRTWYKGIVSGHEVYMLHFEYFTGEQGFEVENSPLSNSSSPFRRRSDLEDGLAILQEGYRNTFEESSGGRVPPSTLSTSEQGKEFIKDYEKFRSDAYNDSEGYCTIGYGYLIAKSRCENIILPSEFQNGITKERALELFDQKLSEFESAVRSNISVNLHQHEFDALVSLLYNTGAHFLNVGGANNGETQIKIKINNGDYNGGADEFADVTNGGKSGLVKRRTQEINMFKNNIYDSTH